MHGRVVDIDLCALHVGLGNLDLLLLGIDLRAQHRHGRARGLLLLVRNEVTPHQVLVARLVAHCLSEIRLVLRQGRPGAGQLRQRLQQPGAVLRVIEPRENLALRYVLTLFDEHLSECTGDLRRHRRLNARRDIAGRLQNGGRAGGRGRGHGCGLVDLELRCAQEEVIPGRAGPSQQQHRHDDADDQARSTRVALGVLLTLSALDAQLMQQLFLLFYQ